MDMFFCLVSHHFIKTSSSFCSSSINGFSKFEKYVTFVMKNYSVNNGRHCYVNVDNDNLKSANEWSSACKWNSTQIGFEVGLFDHSGPKATKTSKCQSETTSSFQNGKIDFFHQRIICLSTVYCSLQQIVYIQTNEWYGEEWRMEENWWYFMWCSSTFEMHSVWCRYSHACVCYANIVSGIATSNGHTIWKWLTTVPQSLHEKQSRTSTVRYNESRERGRER